MRTRDRSILCAVVLALACAAGCGSDDDAVVVGDKDGGGSGGSSGKGGGGKGGSGGGAAGASSGGTSGAGGDASATGGTAGAGTGGGTAGASTGGAAGDGTAGATGGGIGGETASSVDCEASSCGTPASRCCVQSGFPLMTSCMASFPGCVTGGISVACDDQADCPAQEVCCGTRGAGADVTAINCAATCTGQNVRICRRDQDCASGGVCRRLTGLLDEYGACE